MAEHNKYKVIVSDRAKQMLGIHIRFLKQVSPEAGKKKKAEIMKAIRSLTCNPQRYPFLGNEYIPHNKYHKMFLAKWYIILYQIKDDIVYVDYILDCRKDYNWLLH